MTKLNNHTAEKEENNIGTRFINNTTLGRVLLWLGIILLSVWLISGKGYVGSETTWQVEQERELGSTAGTAEKLRHFRLRILDLLKKPFNDFALC